MRERERERVKERENKRKREREMESGNKEDYYDLYDKQKDVFYKTFWTKTF